MSSPIQIPSSSRTNASSGLYVPIHKRTPSSYSSSSGTPLSSPSSSSRALSPSPSTLSTSIPGVYTPAELLALSRSPLIAELSPSHLNALRAVAPEVVQTRKQRKALAWRGRHPTQTHSRTSSRGSHSQSESEEDGVISWRRT